MNATKQEAPERQEIEELLPWHAAGTLSRRDAQRVEEALARDPELARRYALVRDDSANHSPQRDARCAIRARAGTIFRKDRRRTGAPSRSSDVSLDLSSRISEFFGSLTPRTLALASGAAVLAILVQAGFIAGVMLNETKTGGYQTASAPTTAPDAFSFTLIRFAPQASADDVTKFLEANKLSIASGPTAGGLYKVRVAVTGIPKAELARIVKKLQEDKVVSFIAATD